ncbi:MAG TPA: substrate-binding domain-containing protein [Albitalea sp.]
MPRISITPHWNAGAPGAEAIDVTGLLTLLSAVHDTGSLAQAARSLGLSYRHAWGRLKAAEALFEGPLIDAGRGRGSTLTDLALKLLWADRRIAARLSPMLESVASELEADLGKTAPAERLNLRLAASHGFAVATLVAHLQQAGLPVDLRYRSSLEAVAALARGESDLAGFHVPIGRLEAQAAERYMPWLRADRHSLVHLAVRTQGLFVARGNPKRIRGVADLARPDVRFVNRPEGSGTRVLTELLLEGSGVEARQVRGYDVTELTHAAVAAYVGSGMADAGIGVKAAAQHFGLHFIPLLRERYFFAFETRAMGRAPIAPVLDRLRAPALRASVAALPGYDAGHTGRVLGLAEAFPFAR